MTDLNFWFGIFAYRIEETGLETDIALFLEFVLSIVSMAAWFLWAGQNVLTPE